MSLDALERMMIMAVTERTIKNIGSLGFVGVAKAAGEIALITAAFETAKGLISNFYTGGFTPSGDWNQPQGIVHSNEFVANRFAVANPNLRPIFDAIDVAQRSGNVGNLTAEDIAAVAGSGKSTRVMKSAPQRRPMIRLWWRC
jgi:phage-related minor tail protein